MRTACQDRLQRETSAQQAMKAHGITSSRGIEGLKPSIHDRRDRRLTMHASYDTAPVFEVDSFIGALSELFRGNAWEEVQPFAEMAWNDLGSAHDWDRVEPRVRVKWIESHTSTHRLSTVLKQSRLLRAALRSSASECHATLEQSRALIEQMRASYAQLIATRQGLPRR